MKTRSGLETEQFGSELGAFLDDLARRNIQGVVVVLCRVNGGTLECGVATARRTPAVELATFRRAAVGALREERAARGELEQ